MGAKVVMIGRHPDRLAHFARFGATLLGGSDNGVAAVKALGLGPIQVLVETAGSARVLGDYLPLLARGAHAVIAGFYKSAGGVDLQKSMEQFRHAEISFDLVSGATQERLDATRDWIAAGRLDTLGCITHRFPVERPAEAWTLIETKREPVLGVILDWPAARKSS
jgi:threonine dehydrogenase-like Zn-dependent dehydrogenase